MKLFSFIFLSAFFISCNSIPENTDTEIPLTKTDLLVSALEEEEPTTKTNKLLFKASGFEPGWLIEIYEQKMRVILDYASDSVFIEGNFSTIKKGSPFQFSSEIDKNGKKISLTLSIDNQVCNDEATGDKRDASVNLSLDKKNYKACGNYIISE